MSVLVAGSLGCRSRREKGKKGKEKRISFPAMFHFEHVDHCALCRHCMLGRTVRSILICLFFPRTV